jgi:Papain family cysteine protease
MNRYKKLLYFIVFASGLFLNCPMAQTQIPRAKGLVFNAAQYRKAVKTRDLDVRGGTMRQLPVRLSLRPFCPMPQDQGAELSCTAWAIAYGALTIRQAVYRKVSTPGDVDKIACSKSFVFNQVTENDPNNIPSIEETFAFLRAKGTCLAATFRNDLPITEKPDALAFEEAQGRRVAVVTEVYDPDSSVKIQRQIQRFKRFLADSSPIVAGLLPPYSFSNLTEKVFRYDPAEPLDSFAHAVCIVGYDDIDSTFECMNSWGTEWGGDQGFFRLRYSDLFDLICCAYRLTPQFLVEKKSAAPRGAVVLRRSIGYNAARIPQYDEIRVQYDTIHGYYRSIKGWQPGMGFQLTLREAPADWQVCIFNIDREGAVAVFHRDKMETGLVEKVIPGEETKFEIEEEGTDWLCVLYSKESLPDFQAPLQTLLKADPGAARAQTALYFKNRLSEQAIFTPNRMGFSLPRNNDGRAVLMFLKIEAK